MATVSVRGSGTATAQPDEVIAGPQPRALAPGADLASMPLDVGEREVTAEVGVTFRLEQG